MIDIAKFREMEALQLRYVDEDADVHRAMRRMESGHQQALRRAEEDGYAKGLTAAPSVPHGWLIDRPADGDLRVCGPIGSPGGMHPRADRGPLSERLLHALASAMINKENT